MGGIGIPRRGEGAEKPGGGVCAAENFEARGKARTRKTEGPQTPSSLPWRPLRPQARVARDSIRSRSAMGDASQSPAGGGGGETRSAPLCGERGFRSQGGQRKGKQGQSPDAQDGRPSSLRRRPIRPQARVARDERAPPIRSGLDILICLDHLERRGGVRSSRARPRAQSVPARHGRLCASSPLLARLGFSP